MASTVRSLSLAGVAAAVVDTVGVARPVTVLGAPGTAVDIVMPELVAAFAARDERHVAVVRAVRTDRARPGALAERIAASGVGPAATPPANGLGPVDDAEADAPAVLVLADAQWADERSLDDLLAATASGPGRTPLVVVHRRGATSPALAALRLAARRDGALVEIDVFDRDGAIASGVPDDRVDDVLALTGGLPGLVAAVERDGSLDDEVVARLAVLDEGCRRIAELIAFGFGIDPLAGAELGVTDQLDVAVAELTIEGLLVADGMPAGVAAAVRAACPAGRRRAIVETVVEHGPAGADHDLAALLYEAGDRSPAAGGLFASVAVGLSTADPARALDLADAAVASGVDDDDLRTARAVAHLASGDPRAALAALDGVEGAEAELVRAGVWASLGDLEVAGRHLARSTVPALRRWAELGTGRRADGVTTEAGDVDPDAQNAPTEAAGTLVDALDCWWRADAPDDEVLARLRRAGTRARAERTTDRWPVDPDVVAALVAGRAGDLAAAEQHVTRAHAGTAMGRRTALALGAWVAARRGLLDAASTMVDELAGDLTPYDRLLAAGAGCAIAVRDADAGELDRAVAAAVDALTEVGGSIYDLDVVADIAGAARRSRASTDPLAVFERLAADATDAGRLTSDLARARLVAAMAADDLDAVRDAAGGLLRVMGEPTAPNELRWSRTAGLLADPARADADAVVDVARVLADAGAAYEAARLCGLIALASDDPHVARRLLRESRTWRGSRRQLAAAPGVDRSVVELSEQEERVGRLVLDGHTHKQVGAQLFISPKTVEHHVAHIRTKLGCADRAEMMAALRGYLDDAVAN